jgi:hypothetical protein
MSSYPALKPGVNFLIQHEEKQSYVLVGTSTSGIKLIGHNAIHFLQKSNGQLELNEIIKSIGITGNQALEIIQPLLTNNLLILSTTPLSLKEVRHVDVATDASSARITPELNTLAWRKTLSPTKDISSRRDKEILILGKNRLAYALLELFLSIGYLKSKVVNDLTGEIPSQLVGATPFRMSDIGSQVSEIREKIKREFGLNLTALKIKDRSHQTSEKLTPEKLTISTADFPVAEYPALIIEGSAHLQIGNLTAGKVEVGPIVIPGKTPCYNCILMWKSENLKEMANLFISNQVADPLELPAASVTYLAGLIVTLVDNYFALEKSYLIGSSIVVNLLRPLEFTERFWQPHPRCGCLELL